MNQPLIVSGFSAKKKRVAMPMMKGWSKTLSLMTAMLLVFACITTLSAQENIAETAKLQFFETRIRPLLIEHCHECHAGDEHKGGLRVDTREALLAGGDSGAAMVPGDPGESLLIDAVGYGDVYQMPPEGKLTDRDVAALEQWIRNGASFPAMASQGTPAEGTDSTGTKDDDRWQFWAFQPPSTPPVPLVVDTAWPRSDLDHFVLAKLEAAGLRPAVQADRRTLIRRATFDLIGLPPTPEEIATFVADDTPEAFARLVDRLLASPRYGERWGRHWLDVARYADSNGLDENMAFANAYRYRDYVIASFNADVPYDQFVREQVAGDLLPAANDEARLRQITATGFLSIGAKMLAEDDPVKMEMDIIDEQIDTLGRAFCGQTLGCARCHDHKFDPISTAEYYALAGIFKSTQTMENFKVVADWHERPLMTEALQAKVDAHQQELTVSKAKYDSQLNATMGALRDEIVMHAGEYLLAAWQLARQPAAIPRLGESGANDNDRFTVVEAEEFSEGNVRIDTTGYGAGIGVILNRGELPNVVEYEVEVATDGYYQLELRFAAAQSRPVQIAVDGQLVNALAARDVTGSWNPDSQRWSVGCVLPLNVGGHTIRLSREGPFPHFDKLALVPLVEVSAQDAMVTPEQLATLRGLHASVLRRWVRHFKTDGDDVPWLAQLFTVIAEGSDDTALKALATLSPATAALLADPQPGTPEELANRFGRLLAEARRQDDEQLDDAQRTIRQLVEDESGSLIPTSEVKQFVTPDEAQTIETLRAEVERIEKAKPDISYAMAVEDRAPQDIKVHIRGNHLILGDEVSRGVPRLLAGSTQPSIVGQQSGRLELALWLTRADHPLTGRVMANRLWRWHFGRGLVATPDNFGHLGSAPSHPQLLEWLAVQFVENGWSIKALHRTIMLSATYQMSATFNAQAAQFDPENVLLWRANRKRLEAEAIRDALLAVSGQLDLRMGGSLLGFKNHTYVTSTASRDTVDYTTPRRSVYLPIIRSALYDFFHVFDFAEPSVPSGNRSSTTIAPQALFMLNSELAIEASRLLAKRLLGEVENSDAERLRRMYELAYGRSPSEEETVQAIAFIQRYNEAIRAEVPDDGERTARAWEGLSRAILSANEFVFVE